MLSLPTGRAAFTQDSRLNFTRGPSTQSRRPGSNQVPGTLPLLSRATWGAQTCLKRGCASASGVMGKGTPQSGRAELGLWGGSGLCGLCRGGS